MIPFELRSGNLSVSLALREHVGRKLSFALSRLAHRVRSVVVRIVDINGTRGGPDKRCRILANMKDGTTIVVQAVDHDTYVAVSQAATRLEGAISRAQKRPHSRADIRYLEVEGPEEPLTSA